MFTYNISNITLVLWSLKTKTNVYVFVYTVLIEEGDYFDIVNSKGHNFLYTLW